jgi:hypothetical protein
MLYGWLALSVTVAVLTVVALVVLQSSTTCTPSIQSRTPSSVVV